MQWISHMASVALPCASSAPESFLQQEGWYASSGHCEGDQIQFQEHSYPSLLPRYMGPFYGSILALFLHEDLGFLEILPSQVQRMKLDKSFNQRDWHLLLGKGALHVDPLLHEKSSTSAIPEFQQDCEGGTVPVF